jgi:hypothetical protein
MVLLCVLFSHRIDAGGIPVFLEGKRYVAVFQESDESIPFYAIVSGWQSEGEQISLFNPAQYRGIAHTAAPGCQTDGHIFRIRVFIHIRQIHVLGYAQLPWQK